MRGQKQGLPMTSWRSLSRSCLGMIAGADARTYIRPESTHVAYLLFGAPGVIEEQIVDSQKFMEKYVKVLAPAAETRIILAK